MLEDDVHAAFVGDAAYFVANFLGFVIDEVIGAECFGFGELYVGACCGYDTRAEEFGNLNGGAAYTTAGTENEHVFAGAATARE